jgi:hypothetical protein
MARDTIQVHETVNQQSLLAKNVAEQNVKSLQVQRYAVAVQQQPRADFGTADKRLTERAGLINRELDSANRAVAHYLAEVQPASLRLVTDAQAYFALQDNVLASLTGMGTETAIRMIDILERKTREYSREADAASREIGKSQSAFSENAKEFREHAGEINKFVSGDNGLLKQLQDDLDQVESSINHHWVGAGVSALAIGGGIALIVIGSVGTLLTGGLATAAVVGGGALLLGGIGGAVGTGVGLANLYQQKRSLLEEQARLRQEVKLLTDCSTGLTGLETAAEAAAAEAQSAKNAWDIVGGHLASLSSTLRDAKDPSFEEDIRRVFVETARTNLSDTQNGLRGVQRLMTPETVIEPARRTDHLILAYADDLERRKPANLCQAA